MRRTYYHEGKVKPSLDGFAEYLVGEIGIAHKLRRRFLLQTHRERKKWWLKKRGGGVEFFMCVSSIQRKLNYRDRMTIQAGNVHSP